MESWSKNTGLNPIRLRCVISRINPLISVVVSFQNDQFVVSDFHRVKGEHSNFLACDTFGEAIHEMNGRVGQ